jgi:hypothetical protein
VKNPSPRLVFGSLAAVKIVSGDNRRTALRVFVGGTVVGIVAALDASARTAGFDKLDVVVVAQANAALGVPLSVYTSTGIVLASRIVGVQLAEILGTDTPGDCKSGVRISHRDKECSGGEGNQCNSRWA